MSSKTNQSLLGKCAHLYEVKCFLASSLGRLYLMGGTNKKREPQTLVNISTLSSTGDERLQGASFFPFCRLRKIIALVNGLIFTENMHLRWPNDYYQSSKTQVDASMSPNIDTSGYKWTQVDIHAHGHACYYPPPLQENFMYTTSNAVCMATLAMQVFKRCDHFCSIKPVTNMKQYIKECFLSPNITSTKLRTSVTCL